LKQQDPQSASLAANVSMFLFVISAVVSALGYIGFDSLHGNGSESANKLPNGSVTGNNAQFAEIKDRLLHIEKTVSLRDTNDIKENIDSLKESMQNGGQTNEQLLNAITAQFGEFSENTGKTLNMGLENLNNRFDELQSAAIGKNEQLNQSLSNVDSLAALMSGLTSLLNEQKGVNERVLNISQKAISDVQNKNDGKLEQNLNILRSDVQSLNKRTFQSMLDLHKEFNALKDNYTELSEQVKISVAKTNKVLSLILGESDGSEEEGGAAFEAEQEEQFSGNTEDTSINENIEDTENTDLADYEEETEADFDNIAEEETAENTDAEIETDDAVADVEEHNHKRRKKNKKHKHHKEQNAAVLAENEVEVEGETEFEPEQEMEPMPEPIIEETAEVEPIQNTEAEDNFYNEITGENPAEINLTYEEDKAPEPVYEAEKATYTEEPEYEPEPESEPEPEAEIEQSYAPVEEHKVEALTEPEPAMQNGGYYIDTPYVDETEERYSLSDENNGDFYNEEVPEYTPILADPATNNDVPEYTPINEEESSAPEATSSEDGAVDRPEYTTDNPFGIKPDKPLADHMPYLESSIDMSVYASEQPFGTQGTYAKAADLPDMPAPINPAQYQSDDPFGAADNNVIPSEAPIDLNQYAADTPFGEAGDYNAEPENGDNLPQINLDELENTPVAGGAEKNQNWESSSNTDEAQANLNNIFNEQFAADMAGLEILQDTPKSSGGDENSLGQEYEEIDLTELLRQENNS